MLTAASFPGILPSKARLAYRLRHSCIKNDYCYGSRPGQTFPKGLTSRRCPAAGRGNKTAQS